MEDKIELKNRGFFNFHRNRKLIVVNKPWYHDQTKFRAVIIPLRIIDFVETNREELKDGEKRIIDSFWNVYEEENSKGEDWLVFDKIEKGERVP